MKLIIIESYLRRFDSLKSNSLKNLTELSELETEMYSLIKTYKKKYGKEDVFTNIINHIAFDINYEIEKVCEDSKEVQSWENLIIYLTF